MQKQVYAYLNKLKNGDRQRYQKDIFKNIIVIWFVARTLINFW